MNGDALSALPSFQNLPSGPRRAVWPATVERGLQASGAAAVEATSTAADPEMELRRFAACMRAVISLLCATLLLGGPGLPGALQGAMLTYLLWACYLLWAEARCQPTLRTLWQYRIDAVWALTVLTTLTEGYLLAMILAQPVVLTILHHGLRQGAVLALVAALGLLLAGSRAWLGTEPLGWPYFLPALGLLAMVPFVALVARPMGLLRQRLVLTSELVAEIDPRRGLVAMVGHLAEALRRGMDAAVAVLALPMATGAPAMVSSSAEGDFRASAEAQRRLEALLIDLPACPVSYSRKRWGGLAGGIRLHGPGKPPSGLEAGLAEVARLFEVKALVVLPLTRYGQRHGHLLLGRTDLRHGDSEVSALWRAAPGLFQQLEQAALVDQLQEESAAHERARIGRDLHDSAIQPYLGLKYAVESVAMRISEDNPAHREMQALLELVNGEIGALREMISGLRAGEPKGDNALVPAVRRQVRRFALLFNIEVQFVSPTELSTSRALAGALFHMVNEALSNVRKHTPARRVWLSLNDQGGCITLRVRDDAGEVLGHPVKPFVPVSLSERAAELGGRVQFECAGTASAELVITIPTHGPQAPTHCTSKP